MKEHNRIYLFVALACAAAIMFLLTTVARADRPRVAPAVADVHPASAPNDVDTTLVITGTGFASMPTVTLGTTRLDDVGWISAEQLTATVPWGLITGTYTLTVANPGGASAALPDAFTVTQGIGVFNTDGPYGGDVQDIHQKPGDPSTVFALGTGVGLFRSEDAGGSWALIYNEDDFATLQGTLTFDAVDPDVMYAGTELYRTFDGGDTWAPLPIFPSIPGGWPCALNFPAAHPSRGGSLYVGVGCWEHYPDPQPGEAGVFRSDDYGDTWITMTNGLTDTNVWALAVHPVQTQTLLVGTYHGNLFASVDGGASWSPAGSLPAPIHRIQFNPYAPLEAWVTTRGHSQDRAYRSTDLASWQALDFDGSGDNSYGTGTFRFLADTIWAPADRNLYVSTDGGSSWNPLENIHHGAYALEVTTADPQDIYLARNDGLAKSVDGGASWHEINDGLAGLYPYLVATSPLDPERVFVKTRQGIYRTFNGGTTWQALDYGVGGAPKGDCLAIDPYNPARIYLGANEFCPDGHFCLEISADAGDTWDVVTATLPVTYAGWGAGLSYAVAPHPLVPGRILVGATVENPANPDHNAGLLFGSDDYGQSWAYLGPTQPISLVIGIAYDAVDPDLVYVHTIGSGQWRSTDGGTTWQNIANLGTGGYHEEIATHPARSGHVVLSVDGDTEPGIWGSQDAGDTWTLLRNNAGAPLAYAPTMPATLYAKTESSQYAGLLRSVDDGGTWEQVPAAPYPSRLATTADEDRVILYIGSPGGLTSSAGAQTVRAGSAIASESALLGGGVYRYTILQAGHRVYLPLVLRGAP